MKNSSIQQVSTRVDTRQENVQPWNTSYQKRKTKPCQCTLAKYQCLQE